MIRTLTRALLGFVLMIVATAAIGQHAAADPLPNKCCTYTVNVSGFDSSCFRVLLTTRWSGVLQSDVIPGNGVFTFNINPCPPIPATFFWASLDGGATQAEYNIPKNYKVNGCCFTIRIAGDINGCVVIYLRPC